MNDLPRISSLYSEPWVGWVMFALFAMALMNLIPQVAGVTLQGLFSQSERTYSVRNRNWMSEVVLRIFRLGVVAMAVLVWVVPQGETSLLSYTKIIGVLLGVYALQALLMYVVGAVFVSSKRMDVAMEQHDAIRTLVCVGLYPILLLLTNFTSPILPQIAFGIVFVVYVLALLAKSIQLFYSHLLSILYIILYIVWLELLPLLSGILMIEQII